MPIKTRMARWLLLAILLHNPNRVFAQGELCTTDGLSVNKQILLNKYKIVEGPTGIILSPKLVRDCEMRRYVSRWITHHLSGDMLHPSSDQLAENYYISKHEDVLNRVLIKVWPLIGNSPAVPNDGAIAYEKWMLLYDAQTYDKVVDIFVTRDLRRGVFVWDAAHLLFSRNLPCASHAIRRYTRKTNLDTDGLIYAIAFMSRKQPNRSMALLNSLNTKYSLNGNEKKTVYILRNKILSTQEIEWDDLKYLQEDAVPRQISIRP